MSNKPAPSTKPSPPLRDGELSALHPGLEHRSFVKDPGAMRPFRGTTMYDRIGGQAVVDRLVDVLYDGFDQDELLRPLFPRDLAEGRSMQRLFFAEWLGGPHRYSQEAHASMSHRHDSLQITRSLAGRWLAHFQRAVGATITTEGDGQAIFSAARSLALMLVNEESSAGQASLIEVSWRAKGKRVLTEAVRLARVGEVAGVEAVLEAAPRLVRPSYAAAIMQAASLAGKADVVTMLLGRGIGPDHPFYLPVGVTGPAYERVLFVTPLCAARLRRRASVEAALTGAGAREDIFTSAFLGDLASVDRMVAADADLANASDPAVDVLDITPVDHAAAGGQVVALRLLLDHGGKLAADGLRALRSAAAQGNVAMVDLLLAHGADASGIGVGRWVLHPRLAPLLASRGAMIDSSGSWIGASCTGNQGRKDDPDFVRALLRHGARADDRRRGDPGRSAGVEALEATALHYAAKAGFLKTMAVLLEQGADPTARDSRGRTPLDWLDEAAPNVDRAAVRNLLSASRP